MSKKTRQIVTVVGLCIVLLAAGAGYYVASEYQKKQAKQETGESAEITLYSMQEDQITKLHFVNETTDMMLVKDGDQWKDSSDSDFPVNQEYVDTMLSSVSEMKATRMVTDNCTDLAQYELDEPVLSVELEDSGGNKASLSVGLESIAGEGCYAYAEDTSKIYLIASNFTSDFEYTRNQMMVVPEAPEITDENVKSYRVSARKGKSFEAVYRGKKAVSGDVYGWDITSPYRNTVAGDEDALLTLFGSLSSLSCSEGVSYRGTKKEQKQYGLDQPLYTVEVDYDTGENGSGGHYQLKVGVLDDTEENYYVIQSGDPGIYLMPVDTVDALVKISAFDYVYTTPYPADMETLNSIEIAYRGEKASIDVNRKEKNTSSDSEEKEYTYTVKKDGVKVNTDEFREVYEALGSMSYTGEIDKRKNVSDQPVAVLTFHMEKKDVTLQFLPYDGVNFLRISVNGIQEFLVDKNVAEKNIKALLELK